jgi:hypothetical protein
MLYVNNISKDKNINILVYVTILSNILYFVWFFIIFYTHHKWQIK